MTTGEGSDAPAEKMDGLSMMRFCQTSVKSASYPIRRQLTAVSFYTAS
ncbi:hypothetical protein PO124_24905 [Bacillus licheniformis]|nr:hypothetical protein [Bacillus licheniformis]